MSFQKVLRRCLVIVVTGILLVTSAPESEAQACNIGVIDGFGLVMSNPAKVTFMFWPPARSDAFPIALDWMTLLADSNFYSKVSEYGITSGSYGGLLWPAPTTHLPTGALNETAQIQPGLTQALRDNSYIPAGGGYGEVFVIVLPKGTYSTNDCSSPTNCNPLAHHQSYQAQLSNGGSYPVLYAVVEYNDGTESLADYLISHEVYEAFTDPVWFTSNGQFFGEGYFDINTNDGWAISGSQEIGDMCVLHDTNFPGSINPSFRLLQYNAPYTILDGIKIAQVFSLNACGCH